ncbi:hypothetical protein QYF61_023708 [Mycteria americana]|uniref:Uncharacterized protein n=1 Tax=Mycteria americana TaxID=33587 RepID=A0AAN7N873_MYCAM|nr:hypothetical protein QYF61_023708 [Mycteria americana]
MASLPFNISCNIQLGVICKLAEAALNPIVYVIIKQYWSISAKGCLLISPDWRARRQGAARADCSLREGELGAKGDPSTSRVLTKRVQVPASERNGQNWVLTCKKIKSTAASVRKEKLENQEWEKLKEDGEYTRHQPEFPPSNLNPRPQGGSLREAREEQQGLAPRPCHFTHIPVLLYHPATLPPSCTAQWDHANARNVPSSQSISPPFPLHHSAPVTFSVPHQPSPPKVQPRSPILPSQCLTSASGADPCPLGPAFGSRFDPPMEQPFSEQGMVVPGCGLFWEKEAQEKRIYQIETEKAEASHLSYVEELYWKESTAEHCKAKHVTAYGCVVKLRMCREIIIPVKLSGRVSPAKPCSALRVPPARPTHGTGCTVHSTSDGRGRGLQAEGLDFDCPHVSSEELEEASCAWSSPYKDWKERDLDSDTTVRGCQWRTLLQTARPAEPERRCYTFWMPSTGTALPAQRASQEPATSERGAVQNRHRLALCRQPVVSFTRKILLRRLSCNGGWQHSPGTSPASTLSKLYMLSMTPYGVGCPFGQLGSAVPAMSPPSSWCPPAHSLVGWDSTESQEMEVAAIALNCMAKIVQVHRPGATDQLLSLGCFWGIVLETSLTCTIYHKSETASSRWFSVVDRATVLQQTSCINELSHTDEQYRTSHLFVDQVSFRMGNRARRRAGIDAPGCTVDARNEAALRGCSARVVLLPPSTPTERRARCSRRAAPTINSDRETGEVSGLREGTSSVLPT